VCFVCCRNLIFKPCLDELRVSTGKDKYFVVNSKITKYTIFKRELLLQPLLLLLRLLLLLLALVTQFKYLKFISNIPNKHDLFNYSI
jgi:hypothetical protein